MTASKQRGARNRDKIIAATNEILEETTYSSLTVEGIAARSGVGKATIYRWWKHKSELVFDAFIEKAETLYKLDPATSIYENIVQQLVTLTDVLKSGVGRAILSVIAEENELGAAFLNEYLKPRRQETKIILQKGLESGELKGDFNLDLVLDLLYGPIYFKFILFNEVPDKNYIKNLVKQVMKGICNS